MNYTAAALAGAIGLGAGCGAAAGEFPDWKRKWKLESGEAEVVDEAHIRMKDSGRLFRMLGIKHLEDPEQSRVAKEGINSLIEGKKLDCWWLPEPASQGNPMAAAPDGTPWGACGVRKVAYARCKAGTGCVLQVMVVTKGYGISEGGPWEQRTKSSSKAMAKRKQLEAEARRQKIGIWAGRD